MKLRLIARTVSLSITAGLLGLAYLSLTRELAWAKNLLEFWFGLSFLMGLILLGLGLLAWVGTALAGQDIPLNAQKMETAAPQFPLWVSVTAMALVTLSGAATGLVLGSLAYMIGWAAGYAGGEIRRNAVEKRNQIIDARHARMQVDPAYRLAVRAVENLRQAR